MGKTGTYLQVLANLNTLANLCPEFFTQEKRKEFSKAMSVGYRTQNYLQARLLLNECSDLENEDAQGYVQECKRLLSKLG